MPDQDRILIIDSSGRGLHLAVMDSKGAYQEQIWDKFRGEALSQHVETILADAEITLEQISDVVVALGPGSFTGLRGGIAYAEGLCLTGRRRLHGISTLHLRLLQAQADFVLLRARPGYWYWRWQKQEGFHRDQELAEKLREMPPEIQVACDENPPVGLPFERQSWLLVDYRSSLKSIQSVISSLPVTQTCQANYLQPSYAERQPT